MRECKRREEKMRVIRRWRDEGENKNKRGVAEVGSK